MGLSRQQVATDAVQEISVVSMDITRTAIDGVRIVKPRVFGDARGFFVESFSAQRYAEALDVAPDAFVQDNVSHSAKGVLRGLHFQRAPYAQGKLVSVLRGAVWDVAVDLRPASPTYGRYVGVVLRAPRYDDAAGGWVWEQFWVPHGFAHGFVALEGETTFTYKCAHNVYTPESDAGVRWDSPTLDIAWPLAENGITAPLVSEKDAQLPLFDTDTDYGAV